MHSHNLIDISSTLVNSDLSNAAPAIWNNAFDSMTGWPDESVHFVAHLLIVVHRGFNFFIGRLFLLLTVGCVWSFSVILVLFSVKDLDLSSLSLVFNLRFDDVEVFERFEPSLEKDVFLVKPSDSFLLILDFELD